MATADSGNESRLVESVIVTKFGGFDKIKIDKIPLKPSKCEDTLVEVDVTYCGINFADLYMRQGLIQSMKLPHIIGLECVGIVREIGPNVSFLKVGQRVVCYKGTGGLYRETVMVDEKYCFPVPDDVTDEIAITLPANYLTAYFCLFEICNIKQGQKILIHSCGGGVGWALTQLAKTVGGVVVVGTASTSKHQEVKNNGVDYPIESQNYLQNLHENAELNKITFDLIIDNIGGSNVDVSLSLLNTCGQVIVIGANHIITSENKLSISQIIKSWWTTKSLDLKNIIENNWVVSGLHLSRLMEDNPKKVHEAFDRIWELLRDGSIAPRIDLRVDFHDIVTGMKALAHRENIGKVIVKVPQKPKDNEEKLEPDEKLNPSKF